MGTEDNLQSLSDSVEFVPGPVQDPQIDQKILKIGEELANQGVDVYPWVLDYFANPELYNALTQTVGESELKELIGNSLKFAATIPLERKKRGEGSLAGLLGERVAIAESEHADGRRRRVEEGYQVNVGYLPNVGVDPKKVLFFRTTQPSELPKPEYYWTSDYSETMRGLTREISPEQRVNSVILVASLDTINNNSGLIQDINDDSGLAVRQIGRQPFDQKKAITRFKHSFHTRK